MMPVARRFRQVTPRAEAETIPNGGAAPAICPVTRPFRGLSRPSALPAAAGGASLAAGQPSRRAASAAQYVRMMLAPARRIAVSVSMITLSRSSQPFAAAASAIAYSPLTW